MDEPQVNITPAPTSTPLITPPETSSGSGVTLVPDAPAPLIEPLPQIPTTTLWERIKLFFSSGLGKTITFTVLFLGITAYILTSSNSVLFKGQFPMGADQGNGLTPPSDIPLISEEQSQVSQLPPGALDDNPVDKKASEAITSSGTTPNTTTIDKNLITGGALNGAIIGANLGTISQQDLINQNAVTGDIANNTSFISPTDDGAAGPPVTPGQATNLEASCSSDAKKITFTWAAPTGYVGVGTLAYTLKVIGKKMDGSAGEDFTIPTTSATKAEFEVKEEQKHTWSISTLWNGKAVSSVAGAGDPVCGPKKITQTVTTPTPEPLKASDSAVNIANITPASLTPTPCGNNEYFVKTATGGTCQKVPAYKGAAGQSEFICGLYEAMLGDVNGYKLNQVTQESLKAATASTLKCKTAPVVTAPTLCADNEYFAKSGTSGACQKIITYQGTAGQSDAMCKSYYKAILDDATNKLNETTKKNLATWITECKAVPGAVVVTPPKPVLCPLGTYLPSGLGTIPLNCQPLPSIGGVKGIKIKVVCEDLTKLAAQGPLLKMDPATEQQLLKTINGKECGKKVVPKNSGNQKQEEKPVVKEKIVYVNQAPKNLPPPIDQSAIASVAPQHPVAGPSLPSATSETGPAIWIYGIGAAMSYLAGRRKKNRK